jgi:prephenate dehydratase
VPSAVATLATRPVIQFDPVAVHHDTLKYFIVFFIIKSSDHKMINTIYSWIAVIDQCTDLLRESLGKQKSSYSYE